MGIRAFKTNEIVPRSTQVHLVLVSHNGSMELLRHCPDKSGCEFEIDLNTPMGQIVMLIEYSFGHGHMHGTRR